MPILFRVKVIRVSSLWPFAKSNLRSGFAFGRCSDSPSVLNTAVFGFIDPIGVPSSEARLKVALIAPLTVRSPRTLALPPTLRLLAIPTPPATVNAPVVVDEELVEDVTAKPETLIVSVDGLYEIAESEESAIPDPDITLVNGKKKAVLAEPLNVTFIFCAVVAIPVTLPVNGPLNADAVIVPVLGVTYTLALID